LCSHNFRNIGTGLISNIILTQRWFVGLTFPAAAAQSMSELGVAIWPEFVVAEKIKINKKLFDGDILVVDCHQRLNETKN